MFRPLLNKLDSINENASKSKSKFNHEKFYKRASGYGYEIEKLPEYWWNNDEYENRGRINGVYSVVHYEEGADDPTQVARVVDTGDGTHYAEMTKAIQSHAAKHQPDFKT